MTLKSIAVTAVKC